MARIYSSATPTLPSNTSQYPTDSVVVATPEGLARLPERVRKRLANRWGFVGGLRAGANEVMVHYPPFDSKGVCVEMLVPYSLDGATLELVPEDDALLAWHQSVEEYRAKHRLSFRLPKRR